MKNLRLVVPALVALAALSACGGTDGSTTPGAPTATAGQPTPASPSSSAPAITPSDPLKSPGGPTVPPPVGATELTGTITAGVEPNCLLLDGYLLVGGPRDVLAAGTRVTVTGRVETGMMTTCQQGTPFVVESANRR
ncbi:hypothetical protein [Micromonospora sp. NBC_00617]|uniref:hypothetical protein n=1 Tax=Micromonospora sp. NBC_00617 TaxID=2903587 RepID=UPI0030E1E295